MITNCGVGITTDKPLPKRRGFEHYPTDLGTVQRTLARYRRLYRYPLWVLDPGAGSGNWGKVCAELFPLADICGVELRPVPQAPGYSLWITADYLSDWRGPICSYDLIMGNPPFNQAEAFVRESLPLLYQGGHLVFLLRLAFLEGQGRRDGLFRQFPPKHVWVCSKRPSFSEDGKTNATAFAVYVWEKDWQGKTEVDWL